MELHGFTGERLHGLTANQLGSWTAGLLHGRAPDMASRAEQSRAAAWLSTGATVRLHSCTVECQRQRLYGCLTEQLYG